MVLRLLGASGPGKAYFVERLLKDVLIGESGLAGVNRRLEARKAGAQLGAYAATGLVAAVGVAVLSVSYSRNRAYLVQASTDIATMQRVPPVAPALPLERVVPRLNAVRAVLESAERYRDDTPWAMRWGLYQGRSVANSARDAYLRELDGMLLPRVAARIGVRLRGYGAEPEKLYQYLKAYLMLGQPQHLDKKYLQRIAELEWNTAGGRQTEVGLALSGHFKGLLESGDVIRPVPLDAALVAQARSGIRQVSLPRIMYDRIKAEHPDVAGQGPHLGLTGPRADEVFRRRSGLSLSEPVSSLYQRGVFLEITGTTGQANMVRELAEDGWVLSDTGAASLADAGQVVSGVIALYEDEYIRVWQALLDDLEFVPLSTVSQTNEELKILTAPTSPLRGLLDIVKNNTVLVATPSTAAPKGVLQTAGKTVLDTARRVTKTAKEAAGFSSAEPGSAITAHFHPIHLLVAGESGKTPVDDIVRVIIDIEKEFEKLNPDVGGAGPMKIFSSQRLRELLESLKQQSAALPQGLRVLVQQIGERSTDAVIAETTNDIERRYVQDVVRGCQQLIAGRYPFRMGAAAEVSLKDFATIFGPKGVYDTFFGENLDAQVDRSRRPWTWRGGSANLPTAMLRQFEDAQDVRDLFFDKESPMPSVGFNVTLNNLDASARRFVLVVDGKERGEVRRGDPKFWPVLWAGSGEVTATFESSFSPEEPLRYAAPWGWFRVIDRAGPIVDQQSRVQFRIQSQSHWVDVTVEALSPLKNPFAVSKWRQFSCGS